MNTAKEWFKGLKVAFLEKVGYKLSQHDIKMLQIGVIEGVDRLCSVSERQVQKKIYRNRNQKPETIKNQKRKKKKEKRKKMKEKDKLLIFPFLRSSVNFCQRFS